jgi:hypothetical protein
MNIGDKRFPPFKVEDQSGNLYRVNEVRMMTSSQTEFGHSHNGYRGWIICEGILSVDEKKSIAYIKGS